MSLQTKISSLIQYLQCDCTGLRQFATRRLIKLNEAAVPALIDALEDSNPKVQEAAALALVNIGVHALPYLFCAMGREDSQIRLRVCKVLSNMLTEIRAQSRASRPPGWQNVSNSLAWQTQQSL